MQTNHHDQSEHRICYASKHNVKNTHLHKMLKSKQNKNCTEPWRNDDVILVHVFVSHFLYTEYLVNMSLFANSIPSRISSIYTLIYKSHPFFVHPFFSLVREISARYLIIDIRSSLNIWFGRSFASLAPIHFVWFWFHEHSLSNKSLAHISFAFFFSLFSKLKRATFRNLNFTAQIITRNTKQKLKLFFYFSSFRFTL